MKRIYLSGPVTGLDIEEVRRAFSDAEKRIRAFYAGRGEEVLVYNPMKLTEYRPEKKWQDYMFPLLACLEKCDECYMLQGWTASKGAQIEKLFAEGCGIPVVFGHPQHHRGQALVDDSDEPNSL